MSGFIPTVELAIRQARRAQETRYVVREAGEYHVASEVDLSTFFLGSPVVATVDSYGSLEDHE